jgi:hypothetical protein
MLFSKIGGSMKHNGKIGVTQHALVRRINRSLAHQKEKLYFLQSAQSPGFERGAYAIVDDAKGRVKDGKPIDNLEEFARELNVMDEWEFLGK